MSFTESLREVVDENRNRMLSAHASWSRVSLGSVVEILNGFPFASEKFSKVSGTPLLRIRDVGQATTDTFFEGEFEPQYLVHSGDLVVGMDGDFRIAEWRGPVALLNQRVCKLVPNESVIRRKLLLYCLPGYLDAIHERTSSVTVKHLSSRTIAEIPFPVPPLAEQDRVVEEIEKQLTRLDAGVEALKRVQAQLKKYRASVLKAACEGRLVPTEAELARREKRDYEPAAQLLERVLRDENNTNHLALDPSSQPSLPIGWSWTVIGNIADVGTGATPNRSKSAYWSGGSIPWVTSAAAGLHIVRTAVEFVSETALRETNLTVYPAGTLILAMYGEGKTRGKCSVLGISAATNQALAAIVLSGHASDLRDWVRVFMAFNYENLRRQSSGGVQPNLNLGIVKRIAIPIPPLAEQRRIVQEVEDKLSVADAIAAQVERDLERAKRLRQSILSRAFAGELVPQDPNDEPASKLLERLKAEAPAAAPTRTRGKRQPKRAV